MKNILIVFLLVVLSCVNKNNSENIKTINNKNVINTNTVTKTIKTKTFKAKYEFDNIIADDPYYSTHHISRYDQAIGLDFSWKIEHFDKYKNIIYQGEFKLNEIGKEEILWETFNEYFSPKEHKLSFVKKTRKNWSSIKKIYVRNNKGDLMEVKELNSEGLVKKIKFAYNRNGQRSKMEIYEEEGLYETNSLFYDYDSPILSEGKMILNVREVLGQNPTKEETYYKYNDENVIEIIEKYYINEVLKSNLVTTYSDFIKDVPTKEIEEGNRPPMLLRLDGTLERTPNLRCIGEKKINQNGDIVEYKYSRGYLSAFIDKKKVDTNERLNLNRIITTVYKCKYKYNNRGDWVELIFSIDDVPKYIVFREIVYFD